MISTIFLPLSVFSIVLHLAIKLWLFKRIKEIWNGKGLSDLDQIMKIAQMEITFVPIITVLVGTAGIFIGRYNMGKSKHPRGAAKSAYEGMDNDDGEIKNTDV